MMMYWSEPMRIAMRCAQTAQSQCQMMMCMPWSYWMCVSKANETKENQ